MKLSYGSSFVFNYFSRGNKLVLVFFVVMFQKKSSFFQALCQSQKKSHFIFSPFWLYRCFPVEGSSHTRRRLTEGNIHLSCCNVASTDGMFPLVRWRVERSRVDHSHQSPHRSGLCSRRWGLGPTARTSGMLRDKSP